MTAAALYQARIDMIGREDFAWSAGEGTATIAGYAVTDEPRRPNGSCIRAELRPAGFNAELYPRSGMEFGRPTYNNLIEGFIRTVECDAAGRFRFDRIPAGRYYVLAEVPTGRMAIDGGGELKDWIWKEIVVKSGQNDVELRRVCEAMFRYYDVTRENAPSYVCGLAPLRPPEHMFRARSAKERAILQAYSQQVVQVSATAPSGAP